MKSIINRAVNSKLDNLYHDGSVTHGMYDAILFKKIKVLLGGNVKHMVTGSAPIDENVLNFLKICFCVNIVEG